MDPRDASASEKSLYQEEGVPRFTGTKFACCGKTERSFWNDKLLKVSENEKQSMTILESRQTNNK